jgi:hypothetical protein
VLEIEAAQERLPPPIHVCRAGAGDRGPQPQRLRVAVPGQVRDVEPEQGALDDRQFAVVIEPGAAVGQPGCSRFQLTAMAVP